MSYIHVYQYVYAVIEKECLLWRDSVCITSNKPLHATLVSEKNEINPKIVIMIILYIRTIFVYFLVHKEQIIFVVLSTNQTYLNMETYILN